MRLHTSRLSTVVVLSLSTLTLKPHSRPPLVLRLPVLHQHPEIKANLVNNDENLSGPHNPTNMLEPKVILHHLQSAEHKKLRTLNSLSNHVQQLPKSKREKGQRDFD